MGIVFTELTRADQLPGQFECKQANDRAFLINDALPEAAAGLSKTFLAYSNGSFVGFYTLGSAYFKGPSDSSLNRIKGIVLNVLAIEGSGSQGLVELLFADCFVRSRSLGIDQGVSVLMAGAGVLYHRPLLQSMGFREVPSQPGLLWLPLRAIGCQKSTSEVSE